VGSDSTANVTLQQHSLALDRSLNTTNITIIIISITNQTQQSSIGTSTSTNIQQAPTPAQPQHPQQQPPQIKIYTAVSSACAEHPQMR
jgi:hypothetical protein